MSKMISSTFFGYLDDFLCTIFRCYKITYCRFWLFLYDNKNYIYCIYRKDLFIYMCKTYNIHIISL